jgi:hypothetical protein
LARPVPRDRALTRLKSIRQFLAEYSDDPFVADVAWETLSVELEIRKRHIRAQYLELESALSMVRFIHTPAKVLPVVNSFKSTIRSHDPVSCTIRGRVELLQADLLSELRKSQRANRFAEAAQGSFGSAGCTVGMIDVRLLRATSQEMIESSEITSIYETFRSRNDIARCRRLRIMRLPTRATGEGPEAEWSHRQRVTLRDLAKEAGDTIAYHRWDLRKYAGDSLAGAALYPAEFVLTSGKAHSIILATLASFNLSKAYSTVGNYLAASLNAMLHLSLTIVQDDAETHQRAILNVLQIFSETVAADVTRFQDRLIGLSKYWGAFLDDLAIHRWSESSGRCDEIERFIEGACFLPLLSGRVQRISTDGILSHDPGLEELLSQHLELALDLYETLPTYNAHAIVPKLSLALGAAAAYVGNPELAIRCYWQGLVSCHSGDSFSLALLQLEAGKLMTVLGEEDPENWMHLVASGRSLLAAAAEKLVLMQLSGAVLKGAEANLYLLRSFVSEARARKRFLDNAIEKREVGRDDVVEILATVSRLFAKAQLPLQANELVL